MAEIDQDQKTEQASEKKLSEAMERGQFARSPEMTMLFMMLGVIGALGFTVHAASRDIAEYAVAIFSRFATTKVGIDTVPALVASALQACGSAAAPLLLASIGAAILSGSIQSGFQMSPNAIAFRPENLDIVAGFGRVFNKAAWVKAGIDALKLVAVGFTLYLGARGLIFDPLFNSPVEAAYLGQFLNNATMLFLSRVVLALAGVVAIGYGYEKFRTSRQMMMTKQEVKDEHKNAEGNQQSKGAMRRMARRLMQRQMLSAVATADVVVTNPTHFAVALKYERGKDSAPIILAKGENRFAQRIKAIAADNGVPMVENKPVARTLFALGKVGEPIPSELYQAVASILAVVYRTHRYYFHRLKSRRLEAITAAS